MPADQHRRRQLKGVNQVPRTTPASPQPVTPERKLAIKETAHANNIMPRHIKKL
jgi:hypothetical protein